MNGPNNIRINPVENKNYAHDARPIFQVAGDPVTVKTDETVEIVITSKEGFTVCFPFEGHFEFQAYEAEENPEWAKEEMKAVDGGESQTESKSVWGVRMKRVSKAGAFPDHIFPYCIYSKEHDNFAVGSSPPKMNLNP